MGRTGGVKSGWGRSRWLGEVGVRFGGESFWSECGGKQRFYTCWINGSKSRQRFLNSWLISWQKKDPETRWKWEEGRCEKRMDEAWAWLYSLACPIMIPFESIELAVFVTLRGAGCSFLEAAVEAVVVVVKGFNSGREQARGLVEWPFMPASTP